MPEHYAMDKNIIAGSVALNGSKTAQVLFADSLGNPVSFSKAPVVSLTLLDAISATPYKVSNLKNGALFIGFTIGFQTPINAVVEWQATAKP